MFILAVNETVITDTDMSPNICIGQKYRLYRYIGRALIATTSGTQHSFQFKTAVFRGSTTVIDVKVFNTDPPGSGRIHQDLVGLGFRVAGGDSVATAPNFREISEA